MRIDELKSVIAVYENNNILDASCSSYCSASMLSKHISKLERELGITLFHRATKNSKMEPTAEGRLILPEIVQLIEQWDNIMVLSQNLKDNEKKPLRISFLHILGTFGERNAVLDFQLQHPEMQLIATTEGMRTIIRSFNTYSLDCFCSIYVHYPNLSHSFLDDVLANPDVGCVLYNRSYGLKLVVPDSHPAVQKGVIQLQDFANNTLILDCSQVSESSSYLGGSQMLPAMLDRAGISYYIRYMDLSDPYFVIETVKNGHGLVPTHTHLRQDFHGVALLPLENSDYQTDAILVYHKSALHGALLSLVEEFQALALSNGISSSLEVYPQSHTP